MNEKNAIICGGGCVGLIMIISIFVSSWIIAFERDWYQGDYFFGDMSHVS